MLHRSLKVGASPEYWLIMPLLAACGTGIVKVIGLWNFLRLGSTVTIGDTATLFPSNLATRSAGIGYENVNIIYLIDKGKRKNTCRPTLIFLVRAACGKTACTCGTADDDTVPPSGPTAWTSCRMRDTTAK
ncbi:hypothetical protein ALC56_09759 [Trachymyrmex septentrionalis]|uniref:Uncharacterized protein n=1 Tax=Trachymyrmex septentrionalis TaxID=34720 RepID=A0A195F670_9HYME|nr:hypothetical protein ALC56_09759 [Trachymyrmex septentrionalis]